MSAQRVSHWVRVLGSIVVTLATFLVLSTLLSFVCTNDRATVHAQIAADATVEPFAQPAADLSLHLPPSLHAIQWTA